MSFCLKYQEFDSEKCYLSPNLLHSLCINSVYYGALDFGFEVTSARFRQFQEIARFVAERIAPEAQSYKYFQSVLWFVSNLHLHLALDAKSTRSTAGVTSHQLKERQRWVAYYLLRIFPIICDGFYKARIYDNGIDYLIIPRTGRILRKYFRDNHQYGSAKKVADEMQSRGIDFD